MKRSHSNDARGGPIARFRSSIRRRGAVATARLLAAEARYFSRVPVRAGSELWFDVVNGVRTRGIVRHEDPVGAYGHASIYSAVRAGTFRRALSHPAVPDGPDRVFLDLGSGKGKALIMASKYGFKRVIGVELSPDLAAIGQTNVERYLERHPRACPIDVICADAMDYPIPREPLLVYLHNPFDIQILTVVVSRLAESVRDFPREVSLLYHSPVHAPSLEAFDFIEPIAAVHGGILYSVREPARTSDPPESRPVDGI